MLPHSTRRVIRRFGSMHIIVSNDVLRDAPDERPVRPPRRNSSRQSGRCAMVGFRQLQREAWHQIDDRRVQPDWQSSTGPDARIAKSRDGRAHLAYKPEHAMDLDTCAVVTAEVHASDQGDTAPCRILWPMPSSISRRL